MINIDDQCLLCRRTLDQIEKEDGAFEANIDEGFMCNRCKFIVENESYRKSLKRYFGVYRYAEENERLKEQFRTRIDNELERIKGIIESLYSQYRGDVAYVDIEATIDQRRRELKREASNGSIRETQIGD